MLDDWVAVGLETEDDLDVIDVVDDEILVDCEVKMQVDEDERFDEGEEIVQIDVEEDERIDDSIIEIEDEGDIE